MGIDKIAERIAMYSRSFVDLHVSGKHIYWCQDNPERPDQRALFRMEGDETQMVSGQRFDIRSQVQGYGGGAYCIASDSVIFANSTDSTLYKMVEGSDALPLYSDTDAYFGDLWFDHTRNRVIAVREARHREALEFPPTTLIAVDICSGSMEVLASGADFYSSARTSPCGRFIAWIEWAYPAMPWTESTLVISLLDDAGTPVKRLSTLFEKNVSIIEPHWVSSNELLFLSDQTGWWNPYVTSISGITRQILRTDKEFGFPPYILAQSTYSVCKSSSDDVFIIAAIFDNGVQRLLSLPMSSSSPPKYIENPYAEIKYLSAGNENVYAIGTRPDSPPEIFEVNLTTLSIRTVKPLTKAPLEMASPGQQIEFSTRDGKCGYANLYHTSDNSEQTRAGLIVNVHGGPTGIATCAYSPEVQFWVSQGYSYLDINYRGSTGFGRSYREAINFNWGIFDVNDCIDAVIDFRRRDLSSPRHIIIRGSSAGGFTVLMALSRSRIFSAGVCYYGVSNLDSLVKTTHKFEAHYLDQLIGPYLSNVSEYYSRSPVNRAKSISAPLIFFQGGEDQIVPPDQTYQMAKALQNESEVHVFPKEKHGFIDKDARSAALIAEANFLARLVM